MLSNPSNQNSHQYGSNMEDLDISNLRDVAAAYRVECAKMEALLAEKDKEIAELKRVITLVLDNVKLNKNTGLGISPIMQMKEAVNYNTNK